MPALICYRGDEQGAEAHLNVRDRFHAVYVPHGEGLRAWLAAALAARELRLARIRYAIFPPDYPYRRVFARQGIGMPPLAPLYRATARAIVRRWLEQQGIDARGAEVMVAAREATPELRRFALSLCDDVRYISLAVPRGGEEVAQELRRKRGVAARFRPDLVVSFDGADAGEGALRLDEALRVKYDSELTNQMLAALWDVGALQAEELRVKAVWA